MSTIQIILLLVIAAITGIGSVSDEGPTHRPLIACTLVGLVLGDLKTGIILGGTLESMALALDDVGIGNGTRYGHRSRDFNYFLIIITAGQGIGEGIAVAIALVAAGSSTHHFRPDDHSIFNSPSRQIRKRRQL